jgi:aminoglycoside phosphotransferase (APT) family kinase protein
MDTAGLNDRIAAAARAIDPESTLRRVWPLLGGSAAQVLACEVVLADGQVRKYVVRTPSSYRRSQHADAAWREFSLIRAIHDTGLPRTTSTDLPVPEPRDLRPAESRGLSRADSRGLPVQRPCHLEPLTPDNPAPFYLLEYCDGQPDLAPADVPGHLLQYAIALANLHQLDWRSLNLPFLPTLDLAATARTINTPRMRVEEIRQALHAPPAEARANPPVLCHGDFWPGNLLWRSGQLAAIIDWEECAIGEPLFDLALARLDLLWILGHDAVADFTRIYQSLTGVNLFNLPYWDLAVSLRPIAGIEDWARTYPDLGRPDVTCQTMIRDHGEFVEQALHRWPPA